MLPIKQENYNVFMNELILSEIKNWQGVKFQYKGHSKTGCDCIGLVIGVILALKEWHPIVESYFNFYPGNYINGPKMIEALKEVCMEIGTIAEAQPGDLLIFRLGRGEANHAGVLSGNLPRSIIHADRSAKKVVENFLNPQLEEKICGVFRITRYVSQFHDKGNPSIKIS